jgi:hypothetical protein
MLNRDLLLRYFVVLNTTGSNPVDPEVWLLESLRRTLFGRDGRSDEIADMTEYSGRGTMLVQLNGESEPRELLGARTMRAILTIFYIQRHSFATAA